MSLSANLRPVLRADNRRSMTKKRTRKAPSLASDLSALRDAASGCKACDLWKHATQTVFGEGPANANIMMISEQPGDIEGRLGNPFVGAAGKLLDEALRESGIDRSRV